MIIESSNNLSIKEWKDETFKEMFPGKNNQWKTV
jgi:hypothetical protein